MKITNVKELEKIANEIRIDIIETVYRAQSGHPGGSLSCTDILTVLFFNQMNISLENPKEKLRDRFILSKGHCSPALYSTLAKKGFFSEKELYTFRNINSNMQGHPDMNKVPGVDMSTGSLGQGLSIANGIALVSKIDNLDYRVYCLLGDGEIEEGQIWEAAMCANKYKLDNLCAIVDYNHLQIDGNIEDVKGLNKISEKFESFGFETISIDGNNIAQIIEAFEKAKQIKGKPTMIVANTIKGKGVSFMENEARMARKSTE
jgi:transketolase